MPFLKNASSGFNILALSACLGCSGQIFAQGDDFFDTVEINDIPEENNEGSPWFYRGFFQQKLKYGLHTPDNNYAFSRDQQGVSQFRSDIFTELRHQSNTVFQWQVSAKLEVDWTSWNLGEQDWELAGNTFYLQDAFVDFSFANGVWLRAGQQVIAWGEAEGLAITDILSTQDLREPGQSELQDIRTPIPAILLSVPMLQGKFDTVLTYKAGSHRFAQSHEEFYPYISLKTTATDIHSVSPDKEWELALKYARSFNGGDLNVVLAEINDNNPEFFRLHPSTGADMPSQADFIQNRQRFAGASLNKAIGSVLLRAETGWLGNTEKHASEEKPHQIRAMAGLEYSGLSDWVFSAEYNLIRYKTPSEPESPTHSEGYILRIQHSALNEKLSNQLWYFDLAENGGEVLRWDISYELKDNWALSSSLIAYKNENLNSPLYPFRYNDTFNLSIKYGF